MAKVLIVDNETERHIIRLLEVNLQRKGYEVITAYTVGEALKKIESEKPDIVIIGDPPKDPSVDANPNVKRGNLQLLIMIRAKDKDKEIPCLVLSKEQKSDRASEAYHYGASMYLTKPFNPADVIEFTRRSLTNLGIATPTLDT